MAKKKGKKKDRQKQVDPIHIDATMAYVYALESLSTANVFAQEKRDQEAMVNIASAWIAIGDQLLTHGVELVYGEEGAEMSGGKEDNPLPGFGFTAGGNVDREEKVEPTPEPNEGGN